MQRKIILHISLLLMVWILFGTSVPLKASFDPDFIIDDQEVLNYQTMNLAQIQSFLKEKGGVLANHWIQDRDGNNRLPAEIIYLAAIKNKINPKFLLTMLQKEQSLVADPAPQQSQLDWAMGYAVCDGCQVDELAVAKFRGFGKQVNSSAAQIKYYMENPNEFNYIPHNNYIIDNTTVSPQNQATASLYNYTPHISGNKNFWKIWNNWFTKRYLDGTLLKTTAQSKENPDQTEEKIWLIQHEKKRLITSKSVLLSRFDTNKIIPAHTADLDSYERGPDIHFPRFSLLRNGKGTIFLLVNDTLRRIVSMKIFRDFGFSMDEVIPVKTADLTGYTIGEPINETTTYPTGSLLQNKITGAVFFVKNGHKHPIWAKEILDINFKNKKITPMSAQDLTKFTPSSPVLIQDGELVSPLDSNIIYMISQGKRWQISSQKTFDSLGYKTESIIKIPQKIIDMHPDGKIIH